MFDLVLTIPSYQQNIHVSVLRKPDHSVTVLFQRYLAAFLNSSGFFKYVMGLVNTIRNPAKHFYDKTGESVAA